MIQGVKFDVVLPQQVLVLPEALQEVSLLQTPLASAGWQGWDDATLGAGLDAVGTGLLLVAPDLALLAEHATGATGQLHGGEIWRWVLRPHARGRGLAV